MVLEQAMSPSTRYVRSGGASIAYQVAGEGPPDLVFLPGWISQVEHLWEEPALRRFMERLASFARLILIDRRGTGLSDRMLEDEGYDLDREVSDVVAVLDAVGSEHAALLTYAADGTVGARLAARHPERVGALIMYASAARTSWAPDFRWAMTAAERDELIERMDSKWGEPDHELATRLAPSRAGDPELAGWLARLQRLAASPGDAQTITRAVGQLDVREDLPRIAAPTLVMHRPEELVWDVRHSRYLAEHIPGARYLELAGSDSLPFLGDSELVLQEIEEFLTGERTGGELERALLTVAFTDIVGATAHAASLGDGGWRDLLARHDEAVRKELRRFGGREIKTVGDGFLATFGGPPSHALLCARAITASARRLGLAVRIGVHTGECELIGTDVAGMAVHIAARVGALAGPGEVLVSGTVFGTVVGGPFSFEDRGFHELKGVPGRWPLFALES